MAEFQVGGVTYRSGKIPAMAQFHVVRKLGPVLPSIGNFLPVAGLLGEMVKSGIGTNISADDVIEITDAVTPTAAALASMSDEDSEYVLAACLSAVERQTGPGWAPIWNAAAKRVQFEEIGFPEMMQIAFLVLQDNFAGFFRASPSTSPGGTAA